MATVEEVFSELNFPSSSKLRRVLDSRGIAYDRKDVEKLVRREAVRQVQAPAYKFDGKLAAHGINDRWFCDLVDFTAAPSDRGKRTGLGETKEGEQFILVVPWQTDGVTSSMVIEFCKRYNINCTCLDAKNHIVASHHAASVTGERLSNVNFFVRGDHCFWYGK